MLSAQNYPNKKLSRIKNPFESSQALDSICSFQKASHQDSPKHYDKEKLSNVFQFNERQRVMLSDSYLGSEISNDNESGENIYNFSGFNNHEKVQQIPNQFSEPIKASVFPMNTFKHHQKVQKSSSLSNVNKQVTKKTDYKVQKVPHETQSVLPQQQTNTITLTYQPSEVTMYRFSQHPEYQQTKLSSKKSDDLTLIQLTGRSLTSKPEAGAVEQLKKTFKPAVFDQHSQNSEDQEPEPTFNFKKPQVQSKLKQKNTNQKIDQTFSFKVQPHRKSLIPKVSSHVKQQIEDQNIDIFISPPQHQSALAKDKEKAKILQEEKPYLSSGSSAHSYTDTILDDMRDKTGLPIQHVQIPFDSKRDSGPFMRELNQAKQIVESNIVNQEAAKYAQVQNFKPNMTKKPRKKIFEPISEKTYHNQSTNFTRTPRSHYSPYVSQFQKQRHHDDRDVSPSQMLMKSLNIIDKLAAQKATVNQSANTNNQSRVVVVPPAPLTITQSQPNGFNVCALSPEQISLRKQILDLNFEVSLVETSFDLEKFGTREFINKVNFLNEQSLKLFEKYKKLLMSDRMISMQSVSNTIFKQQILQIRQSTAKLSNFQQKYIQILHILSSLEEEIKDILLLSSKEKYKKIKLLNEAIEVMQKTETYLSLQVGKIPVLIKTYVKKQKVLLQELRDWLKECINKQKPI